jgi:hypothetical protein
LCGDALPSFISPPEQLPNGPIPFEVRTMKTRKLRWLVRALLLLAVVFLGTSVVVFATAIGDKADAGFLGGVASMFLAAGALLYASVEAKATLVHLNVILDRIQNLHIDDVEIITDDDDRTTGLLLRITGTSAGTSENRTTASERE